MTLLIFIFIAFLISILAILLWIFSDYRKYKKQNNLIILLLIVFPTTLSAQYLEGDCSISFKWYENEKDKLECNKDGMVYQFIPNSTNWEVKIKNTTSNDARINWAKAQLIINGVAVEIDNALFNANGSIIKGNAEIERTITVSPLPHHKSSMKIYDKKSIKKGHKAAVTLIVPITIGNRPQFFNTFDFVITQANR